MHLQQNLMYTWNTTMQQLGLRSIHITDRTLSPTKAAAWVSTKPSPTRSPSPVTSQTTSCATATS